MRIVAIISILLTKVICSEDNDNSRNLLGPLGGIYRNTGTRTLRPVLKRECFDSVRNRLINQEHPLVFACPGTGDIRMNYNVAPSASAEIGTEDELIVQVAHGRDCLHAPNVALLSRPCLTKDFGACSASNYINHVPHGEAPSCLIVYCDNPFSECHADIDVQIYNEPEITEETKPIHLRDYTFRVNGFGFDLDIKNNRVLCGVLKQDNTPFEEFDCVLKRVVSTNELIIESKLPFGRDRLGKVKVKVGVALRTWTEWTTVGEAVEKYSLQFVITVMSIVFLVTFGLSVWVVVYMLNKRKVKQLMDKITPYGQAIDEMEKENLQSFRFPGYYSGINENWKTENAMEPNASDDIREEMEEIAIKKELLNREQGLVVQDLF